jgi:D-sedoheptulose 7-phosphate isomerase
VTSPLARSLADTVQAIASLPLLPLDAIARRIAETQRAAGGIYIFGNGGSASTAEHFVADLSKASRRPGVRPLAVMALSTNSALVTALANDYGYAEIFAGQLEGALGPADLVVAISASGNSPNVLRAVEVARRSRAFTVALTGFDGGQLARAVDLAVVVPSRDYGVVENTHLAIEHAITAAFRVMTSAPDEEVTSPKEAQLAAVQPAS